MLKREWGAESNGKPLHLIIPSRTATLITELAVDDLPLDRTSALVAEFACAEHSDGDDDDDAAAADDDIHKCKEGYRFRSKLKN